MTVRTKAQLNTLYGDNATGDISAEDLRDFVDTAIRDTPTAAGASAFGDTADGGTSEELSKVDHRHSREANPVTAHEAAGDPHTGYRLESADHSHQSTGLQAGKIDHGAALDGLSDDDHPAYLLASDATSRAAFAANWLDLTDGGASALHSHAGGSVATDAIWDAKGDLAVGTGANTAAKLTVGADDTIIMADSGQATGLKYVAAGTPSTQAFGDAAAVGTSDTFTRGDHKHAMPADPTTGKFTKVVVARWYIDGRLRADASNAQGGAWPIPDYANAGVLVEGEAIFGGLGTTSAGAAVTFDIKHSTTYEGSRTTIFSSTPSIAAGDVHTADTSSNDGTIDTSPDYTILDGGFFWLYITQVGSTAGLEGQDLVVTITGRVKIE